MTRRHCGMGVTVGWAAALRLVAVPASRGGAPADPASKSITIKTTLTPLEGGWARIESFAARGYGQTVGW